MVVRSFHPEMGDRSQIFPGNSEMARQMRDHDWAATPLGDPASWPDGLKIPLRMLLTSRFEMWLGWGPDLRFFYNDAYIPTLGIKHPKMLGRPFREVWAEVYHEVEDQVALVRAGESTWNDALLLLLERSGYPEETYHSFSYSPLYDSDGSVGGMLCVVSEDTERVISERRLETLRRLGMALVGVESRDAVLASVCQVLSANRRDFPFALVSLADKDGSHTRACTDEATSLAARPWPPGNREIGRIFPLDDGDYPIGAWDIAPREGVVISIPGAGDQTAFGSVVLGLNPYRRGDSDILDFARLVAAQIGGALANVETLDAERQRAQTIWTHARDLMVVVGADGIFQSVSPAWTRILGHQVEDVIGRPFHDFIEPDDKDASHGALAAALRDGDLTGFENRFRALDGQPRWISWHTATTGDLVFAYGRDITEQKAAAQALEQAEDALRQAQKMEAVGQLTGGIAHDFNNLLTGIIGSLELMERKTKLGASDDAKRYAAAATDCANRAAALTQRLLAFSRRQSLDPKFVEPNRLVLGVEDLIRRSIGEAIAFEIAADPLLWPTRCDPHQLESAILNLAINARDAMPAGGRLTISTANVALDTAAAAQHQFAAPGDYVAIAVTDTGHGMRPDIATKVFEPFFTTKPLGQGTGLGLSMVYGFTRQSSGFVTIESEEGAGTTVRLFLPRIDGADKAEIASAEPGPVAEARRQARILVVEDEETVRALVVDVLADIGYEVIQAVDGNAGLEALRDNPDVDLLVSDVGLPGLNGRQLADAGRALYPELKILFMTGYAHNASAGESWLEPGMELIVKPFPVQRLADRVRALVDA